jgi:hypothetical protein
MLPILFKPGYSHTALTVMPFARSLVGKKEKRKKENIAHDIYGIVQTRRGNLSYCFTLNV